MKEQGEVVAALARRGVGTLPLSQSIWAYHFGDTRLFAALRLVGLYCTSRMSTWKYAYLRKVGQVDWDRSRIQPQAQRGIVSSQRVKMMTARVHMLTAS